MSNKNNFIEKVKDLIFSENVNQEFADYKEKDGKILRTESLEEGNEIKEINENGEVVDLEDGQYIIPEENLELNVKSSVIESIEEVMSDDNEDEEMEEESFIDAVLKDGTNVRVDRLEVGGKVEVIDEEGNADTAPEGSHELEDGTVIVVDSDGIITEIAEVESDEESEENDEEFNNEKDEKGFEEKANEWFKEKFESNSELKELFTKMEETFNKANKVIEEFENIKNENEELKQKFNKFSKEPSEESLSNKVEFKEMTKDDKLKYFGKR